MVFLECFFPFLLPFSSKVRLREDSPPLFGRFSSSSMDFLPFLECFFLEFFSSSSSMDFCSEREFSTCSMDFLPFLECFFLEFFSSSSSMDCVALSKLSSFSSSSSMDFCSEREFSTCSMVLLCFFFFMGLAVVCELVRFKSPAAA